MSVHLIECAAEVQLPPALKLALLCFADSGSTEGRVAKPGLDNLMRWTGVKRSRALEVVELLKELQLIAAHKRAYRGQRAEFVVFPNGCCERHGKASATVLEPVEESPEDQPENGSATPDPLPASRLSTGSATPDPVGSNGSDPGTGMGPIRGVEWVRSPRSNREPSKYLPPKAISPGTDCPQQPLPPRELSGISIEFGRGDEPPRGIAVVPPGGGRPLGCRHCDAGWICDADGVPVATCPHCHPAHRQETA